MPRIVVLALALVTGAAGAAPKAYVGNFEDDTVSVVDLGDARVVATIPVSAGPHGMVSTRDGRQVWIGGDGASNVDVIDVASDRVVASVVVGKAPHGLAATPDGMRVLAAVYGEDRVAAIDVATKAVVGSVAVAKPHTIAVAPDGRLAYVSSQQPGDFALVVVDLSTLAVVRRVPLPKPPRDLEFGFDGRALYFTEAGVDAIQVLDPASDRIVAQIPSGASPHIASLYRGAPGGTAIVQGPGELMLFDPATNLPLRSFAVGRQPHWIASTGTANGVVVTNEGSNDVVIVDLASGRMTHVAVGTAPRKVTVPIDPSTASTTAASAPGRIAIAQFAFGPADLRIDRGGEVSWTNEDGAPHGVSFSDGVAGDDLMLPGATHTRHFEATGTYEYFCPIHPFMRGRVVVGSRS